MRTKRNAAALECFGDRHGRSTGDVEVEQRGVERFAAGDRRASSTPPTGPSISRPNSVSNPGRTIDDLWLWRLRLRLLTGADKRLSGPAMSTVREMAESQQKE